jgi:4-hydroxybenzoate polyprenyltransferase
MRIVSNHAARTTPTFVRRWWIYQAERFPLVQHGPLVAVFSYSAVCFSRLLRTPADAPFEVPSLSIGAVAFVCCLCLFLQLRIADEFKDLKEDTRYRPYRPVPRGLVTLRALAVLGVGLGLLQLALTVLHEPRLLVLLGVTWAYFALMSREFFVRQWLKHRPLVYLFSHMAIMPLIDLFATGCDWVGRETEPPVIGLVLFLAASYFNGVVIEIGRKIRAPDDEEDGVQTYSALWGRGRAVTGWLLAMMTAGGFAIAAAARIGGLILVGCTVVALLCTVCVIAVRFLKRPSPGAGTRIEALSGVWIIAVYLMLGIVPAVVRACAG